MFLDADFPQMIAKQKGGSVFFIERQPWPASGVAGMGDGASDRLSDRICSETCRRYPR